MLQRAMRRSWILILALLLLTVRANGWTRAGQEILGRGEAFGRLAWPILATWWPLLFLLALAVWPSWWKPAAWWFRAACQPLWAIAAAIVVGGLLVFVLVVLPAWFVPAGKISAADQFYRARNDVRTTLLQSLAGLVVGVGVYFTGRQVYLNREGQITERFTRSVNQLGSKDGDVRLGGLYALERIARDSKSDRRAIAEILTAYIRRRAPWDPAREDQPSTAVEQDDLPRLQARAPDVQAALTVLGRSAVSQQGAELDLVRTDLRHAQLSGSSFQRANLNDANLTGGLLYRAWLPYALLNGVNLSRAWLDGADLTGAKLRRANLTGASLRRTWLLSALLEEAALLDAWLYEADLTGASLDGANLTRARLELAKFVDASLRRADLTGTSLHGAILTRARLDGVNLTDAVLADADLTDAWLYGANLTGAILDRAKLKGARLAGADLTGAHLGFVDGPKSELSPTQLNRAHLDESTILPSHLLWDGDRREVIRRHADQSADAPSGQT